MGAQYVWTTGVLTAIFMWCCTIILAGAYHVIGKDGIKVLKYGGLMSVLCLVCGAVLALINYAYYKVW